MFHEEQPRGSFSITSVKKITYTYLIAQKQLRKELIVDIELIRCYRHCFLMYLAYNI
jgi:hypothetical protein